MARFSPAAQAPYPLLVHERGPSPHAQRTVTLLSCALCASLLGRCECGGRAERLLALLAPAGPSLPAGCHAGMSRACRCFSAAAVAGLASQARLACRQQTAVIALSWRGARASVPEGRPRRAAPRVSESRRSASSRRRRRRPPPTSAARRPSTPPGRAVDRPDAAPSDRHRPPTPTRSLADGAAVTRRLRRRGRRCDRASQLVAARGPRPWPGVSLRGDTHGCRMHLYFLYMCRFSQSYVQIFTDYVQIFTATVHSSAVKGGCAYE